MSENNGERQYSLTEDEYESLKQHFGKEELLWKYKRALEEADEEKEEKIKYREQITKFQERISELESELYIDRNRIYEIIDRETEPLKKELERKQTAINQIDDILNELFSVTHDVAKTPEGFKKILKENADNYKAVSDVIPKEPIKVADLIIENFKQGIYPIYEKDSNGNIKYMDIDGEKYKVETGKYRKYEEVRQIAEYLLVYCNRNLENKGEV